MSVLFLPPPSASSIPDASETVSGKIRIATSAEATTGTNDLTAMTPAKVKTVVDAAVVGGVTYKGTFDTSSPVDLSNALKGDMYVISVAGTYQGIVWAVGDHLLINEDMGGTVSPSKIDKVDNTDAVTSVAGKTGAVTLVPSDITGLATVASTGSYSDLSGTPTNVSSFANDAGYLTDITGENIGDLADVTVTTPSAGQGLIYNGTLSVFQNATITASVPSASETVEGIIEIATNAEATAATATDKALVPSNLSSVNVSTLNNDAGYLTDITGENIGDLSDVTVTTPSAGEALVYNGTLSVFENAAISVAALGDIGDVDVTNAQDYAVLKYDAATSQWFDASQVTHLYSTTTQSLTAKQGLSRVTLAGGGSSITVTLSIPATVASLGSILNVVNTGSASSTLTIGATSWSIAPNQGGVWIATGQNLAYRVADSAANTVVESFSSTPASTVGINSQNLHEIRMTGSGGFTVTIAASSSGVGAPVLFNNTSTGDCTLSTTSSFVHFVSNGAVSGSQTTTIKSGERRLFYVMNSSNYMEVNATYLDHLADVSISSPSSGQALVYNGTLSVFENATITASVPSASETVEGIIEISTNAEATAATATDKALVPSNLSSINVSTLNNDAGYLTDITSESVGDLSDVTISTPSAGEALVYNGTLSVFQNSSIVATVAALDDIGDVDTTGVANTNTLKYNSTSGNWEAGAVAASEVSGLAPTVTLSSPSSSPLNLSTPSAGVIEEAYILSPTVDITVNLVSATTLGSGFKYHFKNRSANVITLDAASAETIDGSFTFVVSAQESSVTLVTNGSNWFII